MFQILSFSHLIWTSRETLISAVFLDFPGLTGNLVNYGCDICGNYVILAKSVSFEIGGDHVPTGSLKNTFFK